MDAGRLTCGLAALLVGLALGGCSSASREDMARDVLQHDASFHVLLERRDAIERHVDDLRGQIIIAQQATERQVRALQQEFRQTRGRLQGEISGLISQLSPEREKLLLDVATHKHLIRTQEAAVQGLQRTIADLQRSLNRAGAGPHAPSAPATDGTVPPTGGIVGAPSLAAVATQLADTQSELQQSEQELAAQRTRLQVLEYKRRLLRID